MVSKKCSAQFYVETKSKNKETDQRVLEYIFPNCGPQQKQKKKQKRRRSVGM